MTYLLAAAITVPVCVLIGGPWYVSMLIGFLVFMVIHTVRKS